MKNIDLMSERELRGELRATRGLLALAVCPECDGSGAKNPKEVGPGEYVAEQCQWCAERSALIGNDTPMTATEVRERQEAAKPLEFEFIFTVTGKVKSPQMCYREFMPHTPMDRWVRCHLNGGVLVLGPPK